MVQNIKLNNSTYRKLAAVDVEAAGARVNLATECSTVVEMKIKLLKHCLLA